MLSIVSAQYSRKCRGFAAKVLLLILAESQQPTDAFLRQFETGTLEGHHYFPASVSFLKISNSFRDLTQYVTPVDDRPYLSLFHELAHHGQVLFAFLRDKHDELLFHEL